MFSHALPSPPLARRSFRRGGPFLFRTIWPEVRATLAEAAGLDALDAPGETPAAGVAPPSLVSRAA